MAYWDSRIIRQIISELANFKLRIIILNYRLNVVGVRHVYESIQFFGIAELLEILGR